MDLAAVLPTACVKHCGLSLFTALRKWMTRLPAELTHRTQRDCDAAWLNCNSVSTNKDFFLALETWKLSLGPFYGQQTWRIFQRNSNRTHMCTQRLQVYNLGQVYTASLALCIVQWLHPIRIHRSWYCIGVQQGRFLILESSSPGFYSNRNLSGVWWCTQCVLVTVCTVLCAMYCNQYTSKINLQILVETKNCFAVCEERTANNIWI